MAMSPKGWKYRFERASLRWQARIDTRGFDNVFPWMAALLLFAILASLASARAYMLRAGADLALFKQSVWHVSRGFRPESTLLGGDYLAESGAFIIYPISLLVRWLPITPTLLLLQSAALALGLVPLWLLARRRAELKAGAATALVFAYSVYTAVHNTNLSGFNPETLALPALLGAVYFGLEQKWIPFGMLILLALSCRSDLGWVVLLLGLTLAGAVRRRTERSDWKAGPVPLPDRVRRSLLEVSSNRGVAPLLWALFGVVWAVLSPELIQRGLAGGEAVYMEHYQRFGDSSLGDLIWGILRQPHIFVGELITEENFRIGVLLLAPVLFLPLLAPRYLLPAIPYMFVHLASDAPADQAAQSVVFTAFVFASAVFALQRSGSVLVRRVWVNRRLVLALVLTAAIFFVRDAESSPYRIPWDWTRGSHEQDVIAAVEQIPETDAVRASPPMLPLLAERNVLFELDTEGGSARIDAQRASEGVAWIALDLKTTQSWGENALEVERFDTTLRQQGWERAFEADQVRLYRHGSLSDPGSRG